MGAVSTKNKLPNTLNVIIITAHREVLPPSELIITLNANGKVSHLGNFTQKLIIKAYAHIR